jgi:hypothetical protein
MTAGLAMAWGFLMGAAWQSWCQQNRRARRLNTTTLRVVPDRREVGR